MTFERVRKLAFRTISQIGISYPKSALSQASSELPKDAPAAGDRFPWMRLKLELGGSTQGLFRQLDDTEFNLLVIGQRPLSAGALGDLEQFVRVHAIPADPGNEAELARAKVPQPSFYLLRPDGHVGLCGTRVDIAAIKRYLAEHAHLKARGARSNGDRLQMQWSSGASVTPIRQIKPAA
jgi:hypothetical protein